MFAPSSFSPIRGPGPTDFWPQKAAARWMNQMTMACGRSRPAVQEGVGPARENGRTTSSLRPASEEPNGRARRSTDEGLRSAAAACPNGFASMRSRSLSGRRTRAPSASGCGSLCRCSRAPTWSTRSSGPRVHSSRVNCGRTSASEAHRATFARIPMRRNLVRGLAQGKPGRPHEIVPHVPQRASMKRDAGSAGPV